MPRKLSRSSGGIVIFNQPDCILPKSFFEGRFIPPFHPDSLDYQQWWNEQIRRCEDGYSDGGYSITGPYYYHLNFKKIKMVDISTRRDVYDHPYYSCEDQELFNDIAIARDAGKGIILVTARGFGKSFSVASIVEHDFTFREASEAIISGSTDKYVNLLWEKIELGLSSMPSELRPTLVEDTKSQKTSGTEERDPVTRQFITKLNSFIRKTVYDSDAEKTRGTRPNIHVFEEIGAWTQSASLLDCYRKTEPSWRKGSFFTTFPILIGTGGAMDSGASIDAKLMFNNPEEYGLMTFEYGDKKIGKFFPAYRKFGGYYEKTGVSDENGAKKFLDAIRERKKKNPALFRQETSEFPYDPEEAFQVTGGGIFPVDILERRYAAIERTPALKKMVQKGNLEFTKEGNKITSVEWTQDPNGVFEILEHPVWTSSEWTHGIIKDLYVAGCDSFDAAAEETIDDRKSKGSNIIYKRFYNASTTSRVFVAKITQRTEDAQEFYWNTVKLNMYYKCQMMAEYTKIGIFQHYITKGFEHMLHVRPRLDAPAFTNSKATNRYGVVMPIQIKKHAIGRLVSYIKDEGAWGTEQLFFTSLIRDMLSFTYDGLEKNSHDETMAAAIAILGDDSMYAHLARKKENSSWSFPVYRRTQTGELVFD